MPLSSENYYSGSDFFDEADVQTSSTFTDVSELPCSHPDRVRYMARRYGQWWTLTTPTRRMTSQRNGPPHSGHDLS